VVAKLVMVNFVVVVVDGLIVWRNVVLCMCKICPNRQQKGDVWGEEDRASRDYRETVVQVRRKFRKILPLQH
jgi:hypothetical protein